MAHAPCLALAIITFLAVINLGQSLPENQEFLSNEDMAAVKRPSFHVGSRYGRSLYSPKSGRVNVVPRNDRFFLGSRYGKRSSEYVPAADRDDESRPNSFSMSCIYTGVKDYYRCTEVNDINNFIHQLTSEENSSSV